MSDAVVAENHRPASSGAAKKKTKGRWSLGRIMQMDEHEAQAYLEFVRFGGSPRCPRCGGDKVYTIIRRDAKRCGYCGRDFTVFSGTAFSHRKMPLVSTLAFCFSFVTAQQGTSSTQMSRLFGVEQKTAYFTAMRLRHTLMSEAKTIKLSGVVEIDGGIFGGHRKAESSIRPGFGFRFRKLFDKERRCIVIAKQRMGRTRVFVGRKEHDAIDFLKTIIEPGSTIQVDGARAWDGLLGLYDCLRTEHIYTFGTNLQHTNNAESFFSGFRRMHRGVHHAIRGRNMEAYATELAWKRDHNHLSVDDRFETLLKLCMTTPKQMTWPRYSSEGTP